MNINTGAKPLGSQRVVSDAEAAKWPGLNPENQLLAMQNMRSKGETNPFTAFPTEDGGEGLKIASSGTGSSSQYEPV